MIPGLPGSQVRNDGDIMRMIADLQRQVTQLAAANPLTTAGISVQAGGITVTGTETVTGSIDVKGPATFEGTTTIGGNASITGTLSLPAGIIGNAALTSPISPLAVHADASGFSLATGANVAKVSATVAVPPGYTQALVMMCATMNATNPNSGTDSFYLVANINGAAIDWASETEVVSNAIGSLSSSASALITGLGSSFVIDGRASTGNNNWASVPASLNYANVDASVLFLR